MKHNTLHFWDSSEVSIIPPIVIKLGGSLETMAKITFVSTEDENLPWYSISMAINNNNPGVSSLVEFEEELRVILESKEIKVKDSPIQYSKALRNRKGYRTPTLNCTVNKKTSLVVQFVKENILDKTANGLRDCKPCTHHAVQVGCGLASILEVHTLYMNKNTNTLTPCISAKILAIMDKRDYSPFREPMLFDEIKVAPKYYIKSFVEL